MVSPKTNLKVISFSGDIQVRCAAVKLTQILGLRNFSETCRYAVMRLAVEFDQDFFPHEIRDKKIREKLVAEFPSKIRPGGSAVPW